MRAWLRRLDGAELWGIALLAGFLFAVSAGPILVSMAVSPEDIESGAMELTTPCPRAAAGLYCHTCGLTRGFTAMSRLRLDDALAYNRAAPWLYATLWLIALAAGAILARVTHVALERRPRESALL